MTTIINGSSDINLDFSTGGRITGDFSNATIANRVLFQTTTSNTGTFVGAVGNGTVADNTGSGYVVWANSDTTNSNTASVVAFKNLEARISSGAVGAASFVPMTFYTGGTESLRLSGTSKAVILSGGSTSANGTGITFPATQSASTDANTLDDYEEGTFTPTLAFGGASVGVTYSTQVARYQKIGNMVTVTVSITLSSRGSSTGIATITGLPFTSSSSNVSWWGGANANLANAASMNSFVAPAVDGGTASIRLRQLTASNGTATGDVDLTQANIGNGFIFGCTISYGV